MLPANQAVPLNIWTAAGGVHLSLQRVFKRLFAVKKNEKKLNISLCAEVTTPFFFLDMLFK